MSGTHPHKLRVAQVAPMVFPVPPLHHGGTERVIDDLCEALVEAGHEVSLFAGADSQTSANLLSATVSLRGILQGEQEPPGLLGVLETANLANLAERLDDFDVIHCHTDYAHAAVLGRHRRRSLTTLHWRTDGRDRAELFKLFPDLPMVSISRSQARHIPSQCHAGTVHHGLAEHRYRQGPGGGPLAFIGRMTDQKRPDAAIRIADKAGYPLHLAGTIDQGNPDYFRRSVEPLLGPRAKFLGSVDDPAKQQLLGNARALLFPIDWPEPFGLVMIEAMACGTPVIAMRRGSVPEIIEHGVTGFIVDSEDEAVAAVHAAETLDRSRIRQQFETRFTAARMAADYVKLYARLMDKSCG